ncbi:hypothetical protein AciX9_4638 (plasmid) [Granulicella tundricola MP5ACTX9]|uniref:Uncharacterized protein n=1 Tax=Granulicella tundricola (strain ATCC BAA-1859 / DSM 23138 / MP5ACTX9) TaxID=1198114 RepID=E8X7Y4_GRATM|nr:hypothetical protein AciX9_4638 [Granulicella tundricola MP5ACTX9]
MGGQHRNRSRETRPANLDLPGNTLTQDTPGARGEPTWPRANQMKLENGGKLQDGSRLIDLTNVHYVAPQPFW